MEEEAKEQNLGSAPSSQSTTLTLQKAIVLNAKKQILLLQRSEKLDGSGKWSLPGGALEYGENPEEGIRREVKEEIALDISDIQPFSVRSRINTDKDFVINI